jgi:hypothetical protein
LGEDLIKWNTLKNNLSFRGVSWHAFCVLFCSYNKDRKFYLNVAQKNLILEVSKMKKRFIIFYMATFCIVAGLSFAIPAFSAILFYEDFEDALDTVADPYRDWRYSSEGTGSTGLSTEQVKAGSKSYKFSVTGSASARVRRELTLAHPFNAGSSHFPYGGEYWIGFSVFLAEGYENPSGPGSWGPSHLNVHGVEDGPPRYEESEAGRWWVPLGINTTDGYWKTRIGWDPVAFSKEPDGVINTHDPYTVGQWTDFVIHVIWDWDDDGLTQIWKNGVLIVDRSGGNCMNDLKGPYLKMGIYAWLDEGQTLTVYHDEFRVGDENSSYSEVAPKGSAGVSVKPLPPTNVKAE